MTAYGLAKQVRISAALPQANKFEDAVAFVKLTWRVLRLSRASNLQPDDRKHLPPGPAQFRIAGAERNRI